MGLVVRDLELTIDGRRILHGISFDVADGEFVSILGASGAGKSTTLKLISGILYPDAGTIEIDGQPVNDVPAHQRRASVVFQDVRLFPNMSLEDNIAFPLKMQGMPRTRRLEIAHELLGLMHLEGLGRRGVHEVSGGQQQRVALARALAAQPRLLLLDEPFSGMDESLRAEMQHLVVDLHRKLGITTVLVTHDATEALMVSDHIVYMHDGAIVQYGAPIDLYEHPASAEVASCFGDCTVFNGAIVNGAFRANELVVPCMGACGTACSANGPATAVVRHRGVRLKPDGVLEVISSTYCGDGYMVRVTTGENTLTARSLVAFAPGQRVDLHIENGSLFVYSDAGAGTGPVTDFFVERDSVAEGVSE
ncbi:MAG: ABC transporter ATP-binding protein [Coriobacteriia bacterium]|nr:ABC transporter ATP-binding protein [Coriobacteriia bacterium]